MIYLRNLKVYSHETLHDEVFDHAESNGATYKSDGSSINTEFFKFDVARLKITSLRF